MNDSVGFLKIEHQRFLADVEAFPAFSVCSIIPRSLEIHWILVAHRDIHVVHHDICYFAYARPTLFEQLCYVYLAFS